MGGKKKKKGRSVNSWAESRKHTDECGGEGDAEQPGPRARGHAGRPELSRKDGSGYRVGGNPRMEGEGGAQRVPAIADWPMPANYARFVLAFKAIAEMLP